MTNTDGLAFKLQSLREWITTVALPEMAEEAKQDIIETSDQGIIPDRKSFYPVLSPKYSLHKYKLTGRTTADDRLTGALKESLHVEPETDSSVIITVGDDQVPKMKGLVSRNRPLMLTNPMTYIRVKKVFQTLLGGRNF